MSGATLTLAREALLPALDLASKVVERRNTIPILSNALLRSSGGKLTVTATDLDIEASVQCSCEGDDAATTLPASQLLDIVRKLPDGAAVTLTGDKNAWTISAGRSRFRLQCLPADDFALMSDGTYDCSFQIAAPTLSQMLGTVAHAISTEETRYYLNGPYLHADTDRAEPLLLSVATDGHRLARVPAALPEDARAFPPVIVPRKTAALFTKILPAKGDVTLSVSENRIRLTLETGTALTSKLIDGSYPDYRRVVPNGNPNRYLADRAILKAAVDRVTTISAARGSAVKFAFGENELRLSAQNPDAGEAEETIAIEHISGDPVEIGFNGRYALDMLDAVATESVQFELADAGAPALIRPQNGDETRPSFVLMPMRV